MLARQHGLTCRNRSKIFLGASKNGSPLLEPRVLVHPSLPRRIYPSEKPPLPTQAIPESGQATPLHIISFYFSWALGVRVEDNTCIRRDSNFWVYLCGDNARMNGCNMNAWILKGEVVKDLHGCKFCSRVSHHSWDLWLRLPMADTTPNIENFGARGCQWKECLEGIQWAEKICCKV